MPAGKKLFTIFLMLMIVLIGANVVWSADLTSNLYVTTASLLMICIFVAMEADGR